MNTCIKTLTLACLATTFSATADWTVISEDVQLSNSRPFFDRVNREFRVTVNITNQGETTIDGPLRLLITDATYPVTAPDGTTESGVPFVMLAVDALAPGASTRHVLSFGLNRARLTFTPILQQQTPDNDWTLVWQDEFDGEHIDTGKWSFEVNCWGGGNNEQQCYTDRPTNAFVENGVLNIVARKETFTGPADPEGLGNNLATLPYTSARLRTLNQGDWQYGRFEIRAKLPGGQGTWPAIWMLPTDWVYGGWAASGEIDIVEAVNLKTQSDRPGAAPGELEDRVHGTLHYGREWPGNVSSGATYQTPDGANPADDFHVYALEWQEGEIRWYVDGVHYATQTEDGWYSQFQDAQGQWQNGEGSAPFDRPFHMLLNLAVGGSWAANVNEGGIDETIFPQSLLVDYVRVYECSIDPNSGAGCATIGDNAELVPGHTPPEIVNPDNELGAGPVFSLFEDALSEGLQFEAYNPDGAITIDVLDTGNGNNVIQLSKTAGAGNMFIHSPVPLDLAHWKTFGDLVFDVQVVENSGASEVLVKLDSGWPAVSDQLLLLPDTGEWQEMRIPIQPLLENGNRYAPGNFADLGNIVNPFVIEPSGPITLQMDNVRYEYSLAGRTEAPVFIDQEIAPFSLGQFVASGEVVMEEVVSADSDHNVVKQLTFNTNESVVYFQSAIDFTGSPSRFDVRGYDHLEFDVKVIEDPRASRTFMVKMDCGHPCSSGDFPIEAPPVNQWQSYKIPLSDLVTNPGSSLDLTQVDTPLVIFPAWGNQQGVVMQVDNVRLTGDGNNGNNPPTEVVVTDALTIYADAFSTYWQGWDCCGNASVTEVMDVTNGNTVEVDFFGPSPTVSGLQASLPHDVKAIGGGSLSFDLKMLSAPNDLSANWLVKVESRDGTFAQLLLSDSIEGQAPMLDQWQSYTFALSTLAAQGLNLEQLNLILVFPDWGKAQGAKYRLDNVLLSQ